MTGYIYKITSPTKSIYVGKTLHLRRRKNRYKNLECQKQKKLYSSIKKHGWANHIFEIIETCDEKTINEREIFWINKLRSFYQENKNGMNLTKGGEGSAGHIHSQESKNKMSLAKLGKRKSNPVNQFSLSGEFLKKWDSVSVAQESFDRKASLIRSHLRGKRNYAYGFIWSKKDSVMPYFVTVSENGNIIPPQHENIRRMKPVYQFDINGNKIGFFKQAKDAAKKVGADVKNIQACCVGNRRSAAGSFWSYDERGIFETKRKR